MENGRRPKHHRTRSEVNRMLAVNSRSDYPSDSDQEELFQPITNASLIYDGNQEDDEEDEEEEEMEDSKVFMQSPASAIKKSSNDNLTSLMLGFIPRTPDQKIYSEQHQDSLTGFETLSDISPTPPVSSPKTVNTSICYTTTQPAHPVQSSSSSYGISEAQPVNVEAACEANLLSIMNSLDTNHSNNVAGNHHSNNNNSRFMCQMPWTTDYNNYLEHIYAITQYLDGDLKRRLAVKLKVHVDKIKVWFQNRRTKDRKQFGTDAFWLSAGKRRRRGISAVTKSTFSEGSPLIAELVARQIVTSAVSQPSIVTMETGGLRNSSGIHHAPSNVGAIHHVPGSGGAIHHVPSNVGAIHHVPSNVGAIHNVPSNVGAIHHVPSNVGAIHHVPSNVGAIHHVPSNVGAIHHVSSSGGSNHHVPGSGGAIHHVPGSGGAIHHVPSNGGAIHHAPNNSVAIHHVPSNGGAIHHAPSNGGNVQQNFTNSGSIHHCLKIDNNSHKLPNNSSSILQVPSNCGNNHHATNNGCNNPIGLHNGSSIHQAIHQTPSIVGSAHKTQNNVCGIHLASNSGGSVQHALNNGSNFHHAPLNGCSILPGPSNGCIIKNGANSGGIFRHASNNSGSIHHGLSNSSSTIETTSQQQSPSQKLLTSAISAANSGGCAVETGGLLNSTSLAMVAMPTNSGDMSGNFHGMTPNFNQSGFLVDSRMMTQPVVYSTPSDYRHPMTSSGNFPTLSLVSTGNSLHYLMHSGQISTAGRSNYVTTTPRFYGDTCGVNNINSSSNIGDSSAYVPPPINPPTYNRLPKIDTFLYPIPPIMNQLSLNSESITNDNLFTDAGFPANYWDNDVFSAPSPPGLQTSNNSVYNNQNVGLGTAGRGIWSDPGNITTVTSLNMPN